MEGFELEKTFFLFKNKQIDAIKKAFCVIIFLEKTTI